MKKILLVVLLVVAAFVAVALLAQVQGEASKNPLAQYVQPPPEVILINPVAHGETMLETD